jgi:hypothetical protein
MKKMNFPGIGPKIYLPHYPNCTNFVFLKHFDNIYATLGNW